jgi:hypothetical protein
LVSENKKNEFGRFVRCGAPPQRCPDASAERFAIGAYYLQGVRIVNFSAKRQMVGLEVVCYLVDRRCQPMYVIFEN